MTSLSRTFKLIIKSMLAGIFSLCFITTIEAGPLPGGFTPREMFSRGAIKGRQYRERSKLRQIRIQDSRMPRDVRALVGTTFGNPGEARPEIIDAINRDHTRFVAGGWMWNSGAVPLYAGVTGPTKGFSDPMGEVVEYAGTDPEGLRVSKDTPITEWWEFSARERRAEFFRARFGAAQQMQSIPTAGETGMGELE